MQIYVDETPISNPSKKPGFFFPLCLESFLSTILLIEKSLNKLFPIPVGVANRIEKIQPEFLWGWSGR
jgi:hypothetical protein